MSTTPLTGDYDPCGTIVVVSHDGMPESGIVLRGWTDDALGEDVWVVRLSVMGTDVEHLAGNCLVIDAERLAELQDEAAEATEPRPPAELEDAWRRYRKGGHAAITKSEALDIEAWRDEVGLWDGDDA